MKLLLVEDNQRLANLLADALRDEGFTVDRAETLSATTELCATQPYDLLLLDLGMPDGDGLDFIREHRQREDACPILVITAHGGLDDRVAGLDVGADDYMVKPVEVPELAARCRVLLRRSVPGSPVTLSFANVSFEVSSREVSVDGEPVSLAPRELDLLERLMLRAGHVVPKARLEQVLYALSEEVSPNALEASVSRLRKRLRQTGADVVLHTAHGIGYALVAKTPKDDDVST
ncbi:DNA-binding response OmpR family regulator [Onishia taeanensis]|uniref:DNA-binding response OmpR family regulator n=1 Tax=Onishia taeanensis TaxID=284577 RepID=A0A328XRC5_9GAMM|nr:response regulator transcription factor [Halomonas taeanensis]RAR61435.1 DNA-binding response OmpR family regulator [Halomonas taeanensis]